MGSSCSSRQSEQDEEVSEHSANLSAVPQSNNELEIRTTNGGKESLADGRKKSIDNSTQPSVPEKTNSGALPASSTTSTTTSASKPSLPKVDRPTHPNVPADLPDLSLLPESIRNIVEGKIGEEETECEGTCIWLIGDSKDCGTEKSAVENYLKNELSIKFYSSAKDFWLMNIDTDRMNGFSSDGIASVIDYIKEESQRNFIYIIIFLNDNPGQTRPRQKMTMADYTNILNSANPEDKELIEHWYQEDTLASEKSVSLKWYGEGDHCEAYERLCSIIASSSKPELRENYITTPLTQTIERILEIRQEEIHLVWVKKYSQKYNSKILPDDVTQKRMQHIEKILSDTIPQSNILESEEKSDETIYFQNLSSGVFNLIKHSLDNRLKKEQIILKNGIKLSLLKEIKHHYNYCARHKTENNNSSLLNPLNEVKNYITGSSSNTLVIGGEVGSGKSYLLSTVSSKCNEWINNACVVPRFVGLTQNTQSPEALKYYLLEHCRLLYGETKEKSLNCQFINSKLFSSWEKFFFHRPLLILIDGIDQYKEKFAWDTLPKLPPNVKIIITVRTGTEMWEKMNDSNFQIERMELEPYSGKESESIFKTLLPESDQIMSKSMCEEMQNSVFSPLQLLIVTRLILTLEKDIHFQSSDEMLEKFFLNLCNLFHKKFIQVLLGSLSLVRNGLTNFEIISILNTIGQSKDNNNIKEWFQLRTILKPFLIFHQKNGLHFTSLTKYFNEKVQNFLFKDATATVKRDCYFVLQKTVLNADIPQLLSKSIAEDCNISVESLRTLQEKTFLSEEDEFLFNNKYLYLKLLASGPFQLLEDIKFILLKWPQNTELSLLRDCIQYSLPNLVEDPGQLYLQLYGRLRWYTSEQEQPKISRIINNIYESSNLWFLPLSSSFSEQISDNPDALQKITYNFLFRIPNHSHHIVSVSTDCGRLVVWDVFQKEPVRILTGINQPRKLEMIDNYKCLLLCGRELRIYNLEEGKYLMKLREVMNQKMPFFGLHNSDHVVALSRSRMYVNMMNLTEGNCVTTFKVGEDRFLSSLTVSKNGKICVCGDDSQKPTALLVWDLEKRKLLYDLRIPHHEFEMKLVAITQEGHYACSVCRELDEPAPNFIVVYDLQSGTLFKRWKPGVNTISITISTAGNCVVVGLENADVMAYDLITGNPRWTSQGHYYPPDTFRIDPDVGSYLLSYDSSGKDRSLRAWDVQTGKPLGVFTPDHTIVACELICEGKVIVLSLEEQPQLLIFAVRSQIEMVNSSDRKVYGKTELSGRCFNLEQAL